jgi:hypothetical protein
MILNALLAVKDDLRVTLTRLMRDLIEKDIVDVLLVPQVEPWCATPTA